MRIYIMLPFYRLRYNPPSKEYIATLTEDYTEQFGIAECVYDVRSEVMQRGAHYKGDKAWIYTQIRPRQFKLYEGGKE